MPWLPPICDTSRRTQVLKLIEHIDDFLLSTQSKSSDLMYGSVGIAKYYACRYHQSKNDFFADHCRLLIEKVINENAEIPLTDWSYGTGVMGIIWGIGHLIENGIIDGQINDVIDNDLYNNAFIFSNKSLQIGNYDYLHSGLGAVLLLHHLDIAQRKKYCEDIISDLERLSIKESNSQSIFWYKSPVITNHGNSLKAIDMGLAHGLPSVIVSLSSLSSIGADTEKCKQLVESCFSWMISKKENVIKERFYFPISIDGASKSFNPDDLRWCYSDLGIAMSFYLSGTNLKLNHIKELGLEMALSSAQRSNTFKMNESHLCHGTAGVAHMFNRFFNYTGMPIFQEASVYWFEQTLKNFNPKLSSGFLSWQGSNYGWVEQAGLLEGVAGIGLAMISAISDVEPKWDRCLLLS